MRPEQLRPKTNDLMQLPQERGRTGSEQYDTRNFIINIVEGALFVSGATFISVQTVLPSMVSLLGGGNLAVGALGVIAWGGLFLPQIFSARHVETIVWKKPVVIRLGFVQRCIVGLMGIIILVAGGSHPQLTLTIFLVLYSVMHVVLGVVTPAWIDLLAKVTPAMRRGRLAGLRSSLAGAMGFVCGFALTWILGSFPVPQNYAVAFFLAFLFQTVSVVVQSNLIESEPSQVAQRKPIDKFLQQIPSVLESHPQFRNFIIAMVFLVMGTISVTFFTVYAMNSFHEGASVVGLFTLTMVAAQVVSAPAVGFLADRYGNRVALIVAATGLLCAGVCAILATSLVGFRLVFVFLGINLGSELMARYNLAIEFAQERSRAVYFGIMNAVLAPFYAVSLLGGWISDLFGYQTVFHAGVICSITGIFLMIFFVKDPRAVTARELQVEV